MKQPLSPHWITCITMGCAVLFSLGAQATTVNTEDMSEGGFGDVAQIYQSMTPQQQQAVLTQAQQKVPELQAMSPEQRDMLQQQLREVANTIKMDQIDPAKLDISKSKNLSATQADLNSYQSKYDQGKITNSAVKTHAESQY